jgi:hypothetical protein
MLHSSTCNALQDQSLTRYTRVRERVHRQVLGADQSSWRGWLRRCHIELFQRGHQIADDLSKISDKSDQTTPSAASLAICMHRWMHMCQHVESWSEYSLQQSIQHKQQHTINP